MAIWNHETDPIAECYCCCGRECLFVCGIAVAIEGDRCRDGNFPEDVLDPIPREELESAMIGDKRAIDLPIGVVRFFRGDNWTPKMMKWAADKINAMALLPKQKPQAE